MFKKSIMNKEEFVKMLNKHDWWYSNSDDTRVWIRGHEELNIIQKTIKDHPELEPIYEKKRKEIYNLK